MRGQVPPIDGARSCRSTARTPSRKGSCASSRRCSRTSSRPPGLGWDRPADAADPDNHAKNRRVEIKVYPAEASASSRCRRRPCQLARPRSPKPSIVSLRLAPSPMTARLSARRPRVVVLALVAGHPWRSGVAADLAGHSAEPGRSRRRACPRSSRSARSCRASPRRSGACSSASASRSLVGVPLGIVAGAWRVIAAAGAPLALFGRNLPVAALIPLTILWFGIDETQKVMFIFIACVPFVFSDAHARDRRRATIATWRRRRRSAPTPAADRAQGARAAGAAGHLRQPAAPVRHGVRLHHAGRAHQRRATGSAFC